LRSRHPPARPAACYPRPVSAACAFSLHLLEASPFTLDNFPKLSLTHTLPIDRFNLSEITLRRDFICLRHPQKITPRIGMARALALEPLLQPQLFGIASH